MGLNTAWWTLASGLVFTLNWKFFLTLNAALFELTPFAEEHIILFCRARWWRSASSTRTWRTRMRRWCSSSTWCPTAESSSSLSRWASPYLVATEVSIKCVRRQSNLKQGETGACPLNLTNVSAIRPAEEKVPLVPFLVAAEAVRDVTPSVLCAGLLQVADKYRNSRAKWSSTTWYWGFSVQVFKWTKKETPHLHPCKISSQLRLQKDSLFLQGLSFPSSQKVSTQQFLQLQVIGDLFQCRQLTDIYTALGNYVCMENVIGVRNGVFVWNRLSLSKDVIFANWVALANSIYFSSVWLLGSLERCFQVFSCALGAISLPKKHPRCNSVKGMRSEISFERSKSVMWQAKRFECFNFSVSISIHACRMLHAPFVNYTSQHQLLRCSWKHKNVSNKSQCAFSLQKLL